MEKIKLQVNLREDMSKHHLKQMRYNGRIPASLYGKGKPTISLEVGLRTLADALRTEAGIHALIDLKVEGEKRGEGGTAVVKSIQKDPLTRRVLHVDFERVGLTDVIVTPVPVVLHGDPPGVREGGILDQMMDEIEVKCRADHIPPHIDMDISDLKLGEFIHASHVPLPEGAELASRPDDIVVAVRVPHVRGVPKEEVPAPAAAAEEAAPAEETEES